MRSDKSFSKDNAKTAYDLKKAARKRKRLIRDIVFGLILLGLLVGIGTCVQCIGRKSDAGVVRTVSDISDFSVVFVDGEATLTWVDPPDIFLDHIEILYWPSGTGPENIAPRAEKYVISGLDEGKEYFFTLKAVDKWGNKSGTTEGGTGKALRQQTPGNALKGTPVAEQVTLSWTNLADTEYDHIEISYDPDHETPIRIPQGVESKTLARLANGLEHTFYVTAVDKQGNRKFLNETGIFIPDYATSSESVFGRSSAGQVILTWQETNSSLLDYVEVVYSPEGEEIPLTLNKGEETKTITGLSDITDYEFTVYAVNTAGSRQPVKNVILSSPLIPIFRGRDWEKFVIKAQPVAGQVEFEWDDPEMADLDHIAITYEPGDRDVPIVVGKGMGTKTVVGFSDSKEYRFVVYGVDTKRNNRVVSGIQFSTPELPILRARPVSGKVTLVWTNPEDPNLDHLELTCSPGRETPLPVTKRMDSYTFTNLSDNQEYEFKINAMNTKQNVYGVARADVIVTRLPVLVGRPINRRLSLAWIDPTDVKVDHIEIVYSPGGTRTQSVVKGIETYTFSNLVSNTEYTFTIYAVDSVGNKHPVRSARIYDPSTAFALRSDSAFQTSGLSPLIWKSANNTTFGDSTVYALSFGIAANGTTRWVAGGGEGKIAYSNDYGLNWIQVDDSTFGSFPVNTIGYGNGRWVAGGKSGRIAWSTNATTWNAVKRTQFSSSQTINAIAFGNGRWIAGGSNSIIVVSDDDGVTWRRISTNAFGKSGIINTIAFHDGRWMAGGATGKVAYSDDDGLTWTAVESSIFGNSTINVIVYDRNRWMAGGYTQRTAWSGDGITWRSQTRPFYILCMGFNGIRWVVGGQEGRMAWSGDSGESWVVDELGHNLFGNNWIQAIASGRSSGGQRRWLSGGQSGRILYADEP
jgi:chitodextrinase